MPSELAASLGCYAPLAFAVCAVGIGAVAICCAEGGSRVPTSGGIYGYIEAAFGPLSSYVMGTLLWTSGVLSAAGVAAALADVAATLAPSALHEPVHVLVVIGVIGALAAVNTAGVVYGTRLVSAATALKLLPLGVFVIAGAAAVHAGNLSPPPAWRPHELGRAVILAAFALTGMETSLCISGEVARPARTIPIALALAVGSVAILYMVIQFIVQGILGPAAAGSAAPLADAMGRLSPVLRALMLAGTAFAMVGMVAGDMLSTPRMLFSLARDGLMPRALGLVHARAHSPYVAIVCYAGIEMILALTGTFVELVVLATLVTFALYIGACVAAWRLARRGVALAGAPLNFRWLGPAMVIGVTSSLALIALASLKEILGLCAMMLVSGMVFVLQTHVWPVRKAVAADLSAPDR